MRRPPRYARSRDANHAEVIAALREAGVTVQDASLSGDGFTDLITWHGGFTVFIEVKLKATSKIKRTQLEFLGRWPGFCGIALIKEQAVSLAKDPIRFALRRREKDVCAAEAVRLAARGLKEIQLSTLIARFPDGLPGVVIHED